MVNQSNAPQPFSLSDPSDESEILEREFRSWRIVAIVLGAVSSACLVASWVTLI